MTVFDEIFESFLNERPRMNYPPYNIIELSDNSYEIEVAISGFTPEDVDVTTEDGFLSISGTASRDTTAKYLYKGIAGRNFKLKFRLGKFIEVADAEMADGMLKIRLQKIVPEPFKPRRIPLTKSV